MSNEKSLSFLIYDDPAYTDLVRIVRYQEIPFPLEKRVADGLLAKHGEEKMRLAASDLLDFDPKTRLCKLKAEVRVRCAMMLGPPPEEWDKFYANVINPPPNPYKTKPSKAVQAPVKESPSEVSEVEQLRQTHGRMLRKLLQTVHAQLAEFRKGDPARDEALCQQELLEAEMRRRKLKLPKRPMPTRNERDRSSPKRKSR